MILKIVTVGPLMANCFVVGCTETRTAAVIDPGADTDRILLSLAEDRLNCRTIINTHGHFDHVGGNRKLKDATGAELIIHPDDAPMLKMVSAAAHGWGLGGDDSPPPDRTVIDGDEIPVGRLVFSVLHTPGHSPGGISIFGYETVFVGDTLFAGSIGRTDFPGGDMGTLIKSIRKKLFPLGDGVRVLCGHGPETTLGRERQKRYNPFVGEI